MIVLPRARFLEWGKDRRESEILRLGRVRDGFGGFGDTIGFVKRYSLEKLWQDRGPAASVLPQGQIQLECGHCRRIGLHRGDPPVRREGEELG